MKTLKRKIRHQEWIDKTHKQVTVIVLALVEILIHHQITEIMDNRDTP